MTFSPHFFLDLLHQGIVLAVARQASRHFPPHGSVEEVEISDKIENLVPDKFIGKSQLGVDNLLIVHKDEIVNPRPFSQSHPSEHFHVL